MKKLLMAVSTVAVTFGLNAATVDWQVQITGGKTTGVYNGYTAYLVNAAAWNAATISADTFSDKSIVLDSTTFNAGSGKGSKTYSTVNALNVATTRAVDVSSLSEGSTLDVYYVILNGNESPNTYYTIKDTLTGRGDTSDAVVTANMTIANSTLASATWTAVGSGGGDDPSGVPEPTSAMLVLVGLAGLALKRKQA